MLEEPILTNEETNCPPVENTAADAKPATGADDTDASNIVAFTAEAPKETIQQENTKTSPTAQQSQKIPNESFQTAASQIKAETDDIFTEDDVQDKKRFHFKKEDKEFFRDKWILSRISDENLMDYLKLEQRRTELQQEAKDIKEKRILKAFEITVGLAAGVAIVYLLKDNPSILVNILYIAGILGALWVYKNPKDKKK